MDNYSDAIATILDTDGTHSNQKLSRNHSDEVPNDVSATEITSLAQEDNLVVQEDLLLSKEDNHFSHPTEPSRI